MKPPKIKTESAQPFYRNKAKLLTFAIALFFIIIMASSVLEIYLQDDESQGTYDYNGIKFTDTGNGWLAYTNSGRQLYLISNPKDLENITLQPINFAMLDYSEKIYLSYNPKERTRIAVSEFVREIKLKPKIVVACPEDNDLCFNLPLKTCEDATSSSAVIMLKEANETYVGYSNNCLLIQGKDLAKIVDKLILVTQA
jgi:hypothetical protein